MQYYNLDTTDTGLVVETDGTVYDLGTAGDPVHTFRELAKAAAVSGSSIDRIATRLSGSADTLPLAELDGGLDRPITPDEVWAAGVTYEISETAREEESGRPDVYMDVYSSERPELFFKATASRTVGDGAAVGIREDSAWDVPEPELGIVLFRGEIVGYTVGNDVSSRSIEGENPLYLPQAKVYDRCCAVGPGITSADAVSDPHDLRMAMQIERDGDRLYEDSTTTANLTRSCEELVSYFCRHNAVPELSVLLTGTSLVPDDGFTLAEGDSISIEIDELGQLTNSVIQV